MRDHVESVTICQNDEVDSAGIHLPSTDVLYHVFKLNRDGASEEEMQQEGEEDVPVATHWILPSSDLQGIWENLVYDTNIKVQGISQDGKCATKCDYCRRTCSSLSTPQCVWLMPVSTRTSSVVTRWLSLSVL